MERGLGVSALEELIDGIIASEHYSIHICHIPHRLFDEIPLLRLQVEHGDIVGRVGCRIEGESYLVPVTHLEGAGHIQASRHIHPLQPVRSLHKLMLVLPIEEAIESETLTPEAKY